MSLDLWMTWGLKGWIPVFLKPAMIFFGHIERFQAETKMFQKSTLFNARLL